MPSVNPKPTTRSTLLNKTIDEITNLKNTKRNHTAEKTANVNPESTSNVGSNPDNLNNKTKSDNWDDDDCVIKT